MSNRRRRPEDEETTYWLSYSDMMAALLLIFILIISFTLMQSKRQYEDKQAELEEQIAQEQAVIDDWKRQIAEIDDFLGGVQFEN